MKKVLIFLLFQNIIFAQELLKINDRIVDLKYFESNYAKNIEFEGIDKALDTFLDFELLYQDALNLKMDTVSDFKYNLEQFQRDVVVKEIIKNPKMRSIIERDFKRSITDREIEFAFVLPNEKMPLKDAEQLADSLFQQYRNNKITIPEIIKKYRLRYVDGSEQYYVRGGIENFPFEDFIFSLNNGDYFKPVNLDGIILFGKVIDDSTVNQIIAMQAIIIKDSENGSEKINEAFAKLNNGEHFTQLVSDYATDQQFKRNGGIINFKGANIPKEIKQNIQGLKNQEYSKPFYYEGQWLIIKVHRQENCTDVEKCYDNYLGRYLKNGSIYRAEQEFYENHISNLIQPQIEQNNLSSFYDSVENYLKTNQDSLIVNNSRSLIDIQGKSVYNSMNLALEISKEINQYKENYKDIIEAYLVKKAISLSIQYYKENYQNLEPDFSSLWENKKREFYFINYNDYFLDRFYKEDEKGLKELYDKVKENYYTDKHFIGELYRCKNQQIADSIKLMLNDKKLYSEILKTFENKTLTKAGFKAKGTNGRFFYSDTRLPNNFNPKTKIQSYEKDENIYVLKIDKKVKAGILPFEDVKDKVVTLYKDEFLANHLKELKKSIPYSFNKITVQNLKETYEN